MFERLVKELEPFVNQYGITTSGMRARSSRSSADIFEHTLLRMAGVKTKPTFCEFAPEENDYIKFTIGGLTSEDAVLFATFLGADAGAVSKEGDKTIFKAPGEKVYADIFPRFKKEVEEAVQKTPVLLKPYIHQAYTLNCIMSKIEDLERALGVDMYVDGNELEGKDKQSPMCKEFSDHVQTLAMALQFGMSGDKTFRGVAQEPVEDAYEDLQKFSAKYPEISKNEEARNALDRLLMHLKLYILSITTEKALKAERPKDANGHKIRFFDVSITDNAIRGQSLADSGNADDEDDAMMMAMRGMRPGDSDSDDEAEIDRPKPM